VELPQTTNLAGIAMMKREWIMGSTREETELRGGIFKELL
jgi:hypothetical protein